MRRNLRPQQLARLRDGACVFCGESDPELLHAHRIVPGEEGGKYQLHNLLSACPTCHAKCHSGRIVVHGVHPTSLGAWVIHYSEDGSEKWHRRDRWKDAR